MMRYNGKSRTGYFNIYLKKLDVNLLRIQLKFPRKEVGTHLTMAVSIQKASDLDDLGIPKF